MADLAGFCVPCRPVSTLPVSRGRMPTVSPASSTAHSMLPRVFCTTLLEVFDAGRISYSFYPPTVTSSSREMKAGHELLRRTPRREL